MKVDLHFHSKYSDGSQWPAEIVEIAKTKKLEMIALTDHDTFGGVEEFMQAAKNADIIGIPAIEIDFIDDKYGFKSELLAYFPGNSFENTQNYLSHFMTLRKQIATRAVSKANTIYKNCNFKLEELLEIKLGEKCSLEMLDKISLTKPDIYKYITKKIIDHGFEDYPHFKKEFFNDDIFKELSGKPNFQECLKVINRDKGFAVLAHPAYQFNKNIKEILNGEKTYIEKLMQAKRDGLWGLELHTYDNNEITGKINEIMQKIALKSGLQVTYGSDSHGPKAHKIIELGCLGSDFKGFE